MKEDLSHRMVRPSSYFNDCSEATEDLCRGCVREDGWLDDWDMTMCEYAFGLYNDDECVVVINGKPQCSHRWSEWNAVHTAELEKYRRRMAGDWS